MMTQQFLALDYGFMQMSSRFEEEEEVFSQEKKKRNKQKNIIIIIQRRMDVSIRRRAPRVA